MDISPANLSLNRGDVFQVTVQPKDSNGNVISGDVTYATDNDKLLSVSTTGLVCAGHWDAKFIVCTPAVTDPTNPQSAPLTGTAKLTATVRGTSGSVTVYVHEKVDRVVAIGPGTGCSSSAETQQFTAKAFSNNAAVCTRLGLSAPCEIPASTVGVPVWGTTDSTIVTVDNTVEKAGLATAVNPGTAGVFANLSNVNSPFVTFTTCAVQSIQLAIQNSTDTSFAVDKSATKTLVATVVDSKGKTLTAPPVSYVSSQSFAMSVSAQSTVTNATATGLNPGTTTLVAACAPPNCNKNLQPVYSNPIVGTTNGTSGGTVYAASTDSTSLVPIDVSTNTAGTAVTLPRAPDSMIANRQGSRVMLGSATGGSMSLDPATNTATTLGISGTVLAFTPDGAKAALVDTPNRLFYDYVLSSGNFEGGYQISTDTSVPAISRIDAALDGTFFGTNGTNKYYSLFPSSFGFATVNSAAKDVAASGNGSLVYLAGGSNAGIDVRAECNGSEVDTQTAANPTMIEAIPNGSGAVAVDDNGLVVLNHANVSSGCPPTASHDRSAVALPVAAGYTVRQLLVTPDSTKALVSTDKGLVVVNLSTLGATKVTTAGTFTGGVTLDSKTAYFGAEDGNVHRIDLTQTPPSDAQSISVGLKKSDNSAANPNLVVVRNK